MRDRGDTVRRRRQIGVLGSFALLLAVGCGDGTSEDAGTPDAAVSGDAGELDDGGGLDGGGLDGGTGEGCVASPGWSVEPSPTNAAQGIAVTSDGTLQLVSRAADGLELRRRATDGSWSSAEDSGLTLTGTHSLALNVAAGPADELVVGFEGVFPVIVRSPTGDWSAESLGRTPEVNARPYFDGAGAAHVVRDAGGLQHFERAPGGTFVGEALPTELADATSAAVGEIDGALSVCGVVFPDVLCTSRTGGIWSTPSSVVSIEARNVVYGDGTWVVGNLVRGADMVFRSVHTVVRPAMPPWMILAEHTSSSPDTSAALYWVEAGPGGDLHAVLHVANPDATDYRVVHLRIEPDGSVTESTVACDAWIPDLAVLPSGAPVVLYEVVSGPGAGEHHLAFGPTP